MSEHVIINANFIKLQVDNTMHCGLTDLLINVVLRLYGPCDVVPTHISFTLIYKCHLFFFRLFTNTLMANFNINRRGGKGKKPLERTKVYRAI